MKKILLLVCLAINVTLFAQDKISEGVIETTQTMSSSNEQMMAQFAMWGELKTTTHFNGNKSRSEMSHPMIGNSVTIMDNDKKEMLVLMDSPMMGKKYMQKTTEASEEDLEKIKVTKGEETKNILGYDCDQYFIDITQDGATVKVTLFTSDKIGAVSQHNATFGGQLKGFPLHMEMNMSQMGMDMKITHEVTSINGEAVALDKFVMTPREGYEKTDNIQGM